jgi:hypothetical protein
MAPKQRRADWNPHTKRQQDDMIMYGFRKIPLKEASADAVMGTEKQLVWEPLQAPVHL